MIIPIVKLFVKLVRKFGKNIIICITGESSIISIGESPTIARPPPRPVSMSAGSRYVEPPRVIERPYFDDVSPRNVTAVVGQSTTLNCRVKHLGDRTVSLTVVYPYYVTCLLHKYTHCHNMHL